MPTVRQPYRDEREYVRDVAIALLLVVVGFAAAELCTATFPRAAPWTDFLAVPVALGPVWWFARRRGVIDHDAYDFAAFCLIVPAVRLLERRYDVFGEGDFFGLASIASILALLAIFRQVRRRLFAPPQPTGS